jgi:hypothetical protein
MNFLYNGSDELEKLEFISRQQLLQEDKIMRDKLNNYVQLVAALTGEEVFLPLDDDEYTFVSISSGEDEEECIIEYIDEDEWDFESINDEEIETLSRIKETPIAEIENIEVVKNCTLDDDVPHTPSQIIRKLKATLVEAGIEQRRLRQKKRISRSLNDRNWSYDMARRRLKRELTRVQMRKAYRDATQNLSPISMSIEEEKDKKMQSPQAVNATSSSTLPVHQLSSSKKSDTRLSGTVFVSLLKSLELSRKTGPGADTKVKMSRADQRLQTILQRHHHSLMNKKEKMNISTSPFPSPPSSPNNALETQTMQALVPPPTIT